MSIPLQSILWWSTHAWDSSWLPTFVVGLTSRKLRLLRISLLLPSPHFAIRWHYPNHSFLLHSLSGIWGYFCDSIIRAFILPKDKKQKFKSLREHILSQKEILDRKSLQRFAGKTTSFVIAVPAARLYTRTCSRAIDASSKTPHKPIKVVGDLRKETGYWHFHDSWEGDLPSCMVWRTSSRSLLLFGRLQFRMGGCAQTGIWESAIPSRLLASWRHVSTFSDQESLCSPQYTGCRRTCICFEDPGWAATFNL